MDLCKLGSVLILKKEKFSKQQCPKNNLEREELSNIPFASVLGSLMYSQICTRPDIAFVVNVLGRYLSDPGHDHWVVAKKVLRYLQRTKNFMLVYKQFGNLRVIGYSDSDFGGFVDDLKSTSRYIFTLASTAISWKSVR
ncbi:secreted RxLR effector protein 161-like [Humulus lupulus]|uniref:secreted RxLR effector protein 161-like n=1 Tax=Humulus lupulus TaxID=3486 RepID=UPI002B40D512|nr:secreted RxLR effector protein 161-like [Humulus lupulus]